MIDDLLKQPKGRFLKIVFKKNTKMKKIVLFCVIVMFFIGTVYAELSLGNKPPEIIILNGKTDGSEWKSKDILGKVTVLFYIDPDEKEVNQLVWRALKKENFPFDQFGLIAVMNLDATWIPNAAIETMLKSRQQKNSHTIYVRDRTKELVKKWGLKDDSFVVIAFDKKGRIIFRKDDELSLEDVDILIKIVKKFIE